MHKNIWETACIDERRLKKHGQSIPYGIIKYFGDLF